MTSGPWAIYPMDGRFHVTRERVAGNKDQEHLGSYADEDEAKMVLGNLTRPKCSACREAYYQSIRWAHGNQRHEGWRGVYQTKLLELHHDLQKELADELKRAVEALNPPSHLRWAIDALIAKGAQ